MPRIDTKTWLAVVVIATGLSAGLTVLGLKRLGLKHLKERQAIVQSISTLTQHLATLPPPAASEAPSHVDAPAPEQEPKPLQTRIDHHRKKRRVSIHHRKRWK